ncbi:MAG: 5-(carboxyamino)imidazole ribonucleotide mutase [Spirochaetes bacterium]|nr:5-(carboxyamino)imidazole ribonucleotide mutase [Spirochaetota bacterium]
MTKISVILGSDSDKDVYSGIASTLNDLGLSHEKRIISAHRTPDILKAYVAEAEAKGISIFIAVAGMAAALPGVIASFTTCPVIGVPVVSVSSAMGMDSLFSMVQMPPGVPVATVALGGGRNAAILAAEILSLSDTELAEKLKAAREKQRQNLIDKDTAFTHE